MVGIESTAFDEWVDERVTEQIRLGEIDFGSLVCHLPGVYPSDVRGSLDRLSVRDTSLNGHPQALIQSSRTSRSPQAWGSVALGLLHPHPLDFEWRFHRQAVDVLADRCNRMTGPSEHVALVATPTLAMTPEAIFGGRPVTYVGADTTLLARSAWPQHIRAVRNADLLERSSHASKYGVVIMDPPWYDEHLRRFLWFAASCTRMHGVLLLAMPAIGTRPGILDEHVRNREWCSRLGFVVEQVEHGALAYETPLFERNALRAAGILNTPPDWRRGDLWTLRKVKPNRGTWPGDLHRTPWFEHRFGHVRLRIDRGAADQGSDPVLLPIVPGDVLPTVSRRDLRRGHARVWTTGNRIFGCDAPEKLGSILDDWQTGLTTVAVDDAVRRGVIDQVGEILEVEGNEIDSPNTKCTTAAAQGCAG